MAPDVKGNFDAAERRRQMIQESKFLGGDMEHTHLVKGKAENLKVKKIVKKFVEKIRQKIRQKDSSKNSTNDSRIQIFGSKVRLKS